MQDNAALAAEFGVSEMPDGGDFLTEAEEEEEAIPVTEAVRSVRGSEEPFNWVLIAAKQ
jgi:hypothetical protein